MKSSVNNNFGKGQVEGKVMGFYSVFRYFQSRELRFRVLFDLRKNREKRGRLRKGQGGKTGIIKSDYLK